MHADQDHTEKRERWIMVGPLDRFFILEKLGDAQQMSVHCQLRAVVKIKSLKFDLIL